MGSMYCMVCRCSRKTLMRTTARRSSGLELSTMAKSWCSLYPRASKPRSTNSKNVRRFSGEGEVTKMFA